MANREIAVNTSTLSGDINELRGALGDARAYLTEMFNQLGELDLMWDGPANEAFKKQFANDYENAKNLCNTIDSLLGNMEYAREQYDACENEIRGIVSAISI